MPCDFWGFSVASEPMPFLVMVPCTIQDCPSLACVAQRLAAPLDAGCLPAFSDLDLVECRSEPLRKFLSVVIGPEVHEEQPRLVAQHVVVKRCNLDPVCPKRPQDRVHLVRRQDEVTRDRGLA